MPNRRKVLIGLGGSIAIAGCTGDTDEEEPEPEEEEPEPEETESEPDIDNEALAQQAADVIDEELGLDPVDENDPGWEIAGEDWFVEYFTSGDQRFDFQVVGGAYAGIVDSGFEYNAVLMGNEEEIGAGGYNAEIEREWAVEFMNDEISEDEYLDRIEDTV